MGSWEAQIAITNGAGGGTETNRGKQFTGTVNFVQPLWRVGVSASNNYNDGQDRRMQAVFGGLRTGFVGWLAEVVNIVDDGTPTGRVSQTATLAEANLELARGHNLRLTYEWLDPNRDVAEDQRERYSVVYEYSPFQFTQFRLGARKNRGVPQDDTQNTTVVFLQWHAFF